MGCDRCAKRLVCLCPWRRTVEGHALTGPLRSVRTYPRPLPLQSQRRDCGRRGGCSGGSVAATPQKRPRQASETPRGPGFLHVSLTLGALSSPFARRVRERLGPVRRFQAAIFPRRRHDPARFGAGSGRQSRLGGRADSRRPPACQVPRRRQAMAHRILAASPTREAAGDRLRSPAALRRRRAPLPRRRSPLRPGRHRARPPAQGPAGRRRPCHRAPRRLGGRARRRRIGRGDRL